VLPETQKRAEVFRRRAGSMSEKQLPHSTKTTANTREKALPSYRRHRQSGQAIVTLTDGAGNRRDVLLGKYGTAASRQEYVKVIGEWQANGRQLPTKDKVSDLTVTELIDRYWPWVRSYYRRPDGTETQEVTGFLYTLRPLRHLYGRTLARDFGPLALKAVRELMVHGYDHPKHGPQPALSRGTTNQRVKRIRRMFKWAVENELVPATTLHGLQAVQGLKRGRSDARETEPVKPVSRAVVEDTLPLLRPMQADMVWLQLETGCRPGELVVMRAIDIDMTGKVWLYRPAQHKTLHHNHSRIVPIGPRGQDIIRRYLVADTTAYLFSPARMMEERRAALRLARKTKVQPSQRDRRKAMPKKKPGCVYLVSSYDRAIAEAIKRYNAGRPEAEHIPHWHPHQLRHTRALELKREAGLDVARAVLGHKSPTLTEHYAGLDIAAAAEVMAKIG
jgi:integrase